VTAGTDIRFFLRCDPQAAGKGPARKEDLRQPLDSLLPVLGHMLTELSNSGAHDKMNFRQVYKRLVATHYQYKHKYQCVKQKMQGFDRRRWIGKWQDHVVVLKSIWPY
jgi:hypothetical protein